MRSLSAEEIEDVSGGWEWSINIGDFIEVSGTGEELAAAYDWAVDRTADFFTWWDPMGYYDHQGC